MKKYGIMMYGTNQQKGETKMNSTVKSKDAIRKLVGTAVLSALVVVLQLFASGVKIGALPFTFTFSLVPIVIGAVLYGCGSGAFLGGVFGLVVAIATVTGADVGAHMMFEKLPVLTVALCMLKGIAAGLVAGLVFRALQKAGKETFGIILASLVCPTVNTGIFIVALLAFYRDIAAAWMGDSFSNLLIYVFVGIVGINYLVELAINTILAPIIIRVIGIIKKQN